MTKKEPEQIAVSATQEGEVLAIFHEGGTGFSWTGSPDRARWLARELMSAADRVEGYAAYEQLCKGVISGREGLEDDR